MNQTLLSSFGTPFERVENALAALREGRGVMVLDDEDRENEGDMIFPAETMTVEQMALTIRHGSGIVCLCITEDRRKQLDLPMMVELLGRSYCKCPNEGIYRIYYLEIPAVLLYFQE